MLYSVFMLKFLSIQFSQFCIITQKPSKQINHVSWGQYQILTSIQTLYDDLLYIFIAGKYNNHENTTLIYKFTQPAMFCF